jgi:hypothetical protein
MYNTVVCQQIGLLKYENIFKDETNAIQGLNKCQAIS